jgi:hypothetical protein
MAAEEKNNNFDVHNPYAVAPNESSVPIFNPYAQAENEPMLSFFGADVPTYALPRIPKQIPSWQDYAINILRKESK